MDVRRYGISLRPKAEWAIDSEAMKAKGIIVLVKSDKLVETKHLWQVKARHQYFSTAKTLQIWRALFATNGL
mgnify:FL=1